MNSRSESYPGAGSASDHSLLLGSFLAPAAPSPSSGEMHADTHLFTHCPTRKVPSHICPVLFYAVHSPPCLPLQVSWNVTSSVKSVPIQPPGALSTNPTVRGILPYCNCPFLLSEHNLQKPRALHSSSFRDLHTAWPMVGALNIWCIKKCCHCYY